MEIIAYLIVGLVAGALARLLVPGRDPMGILGTLLLGLVGSFIGGLFVRTFSDAQSVGIIGSVIGAIVALLIYRAVTRGNRSAV